MSPNGLSRLTDHPGHDLDTARHTDVVLVNIRRALSRRVVTLAAGALPAGAALLTAGYLLHRPAPAPSITPLGSCELTVMRRVPVPPPADMTFSQIVTRSATGGYEITGVVDAYPQAGPPGRWSWVCDAEMRPGVGWYAWLVTVTPRADLPAPYRS